MCRGVTLCQPNRARRILVADTASTAPAKGVPTRDRHLPGVGSIAGAYLWMKMRLQVRITPSHKRELTGAPAMPQPSRPNRI